MIDLMPHILVSLIAIGIGLAFVSADWRSATSRALALSLCGTGVAFFLNGAVLKAPESAPWWSGWLALPEAVALAGILEWLLRVRRTVPAPIEFDTRAGDRVLRVGQFAVLVYLAMSVAWPEQRLLYFIRAAERVEVFRTATFWLFCAPVLVAMLAGLASMLLLLNRRPDPSETIRALAMAVAVPFFIAGFVLPLDVGVLSVVLGEIALLVGSVHYNVRQGQRGQFMARFLSPEVVRLVNRRGLSAAMKERSLTITAVACDLRGFTSFAREVPSQRVIQVLREYYDAVGAVVAEYGGTIKDYAGDGVLILVGAPLPMKDHAPRAIQLAQRLRAVCQALTAQWSGQGPALGIGIGLASGPVTVGVIGGVSRLEYTAVGTAVNLASRLCDQAADGDILMDALTAELAQFLGAPREPLPIKGFAEPVAIVGVQ